MTNCIHAYVDETGTNELDTTKAGVSKYFICVAVIVDEREVADLTLHMEAIAKDLCGGAEIASKKIRSNSKRRRKFLAELSGQKFGYYAILIRKDAVKKESGLKHKKSFYKCINKMLYERITQSGRSVKIIADTIGGQDFMDSFDGYLTNKLKPDLFFNYTHEFADSAACRLIQLADLIAGTLAQCFEPSKRTPESVEFREMIRPFEFAIDSWPRLAETTDDEGTAPIQPNADISEALLTRVQRFIQKEDAQQDEIERMQVSVLKMLLFAKEFEAPSKQFISSDQLRISLAEQGLKEISKRAFTKEVIGGIRLKGIIIAGTKNGYKLALNEHEISEYLDHNKSIIEPMLARLAEARKTVKLDTANQLDILSEDPYRLLAKLVECASIQETNDDEQI